MLRREWGLVSIKNPFKEDKSTLSSELDAELVHANLGDIFIWVHSSWLLGVDHLCLIFTKKGWPSTVRWMCITEVLCPRHVSLGTFF